jgi:hypothetical protein
MGCAFSAKNPKNARNLDREHSKRIISRFKRKACSLLLKIAAVICSLQKMIENCKNKSNYSSSGYYQQHESAFKAKMKSLTLILAQLQDAEKGCCRDFGYVKIFLKNTSIS